MQHTELSTLTAAGTLHWTCQRHLLPELPMASQMPAAHLLEASYFCLSASDQVH